MSLIALAEENNLPDFQFIDKDTLCWIKNNKPKFVISIIMNKLKVTKYIW